MNGAMGFGLGLLAGILLFAVVRRLLQTESASVTDIIATCSGNGMANFTVTVTADAGSTTTGIFWKLYDDPGATVPGAPDAGVTHVGGAGPTFNLVSVPVSSVDADKIAVWPEYKSTGAPATRNVGPCSTTSTTPTTPTTLPPHI